MEDFSIKLMRFIAATVYTQLSLQASHDLFQKSMFDLSEQQRKEVHDKLYALVSPAYELMTEKNLTPSQGGHISGGMA